MLQIASTKVSRRIRRAKLNLFDLFMASKLKNTHASEIIIGDKTTTYCLGLGDWDEGGGGDRNWDFNRRWKGKVSSSWRNVKSQMRSFLFVTMTMERCEQIFLLLKLAWPPHGLMMISTDWWWKLRPLSYLTSTISSAKLEWSNEMFFSTSLIAAWVFEISDFVFRFALLSPFYRWRDHSSSGWKGIKLTSNSIMLSLVWKDFNFSFVLYCKHSWGILEGCW